VPLHRLDHNGYQGPQPLAADPVRCLPDHDQCFPCSVAVHSASGSRARTPNRLTSTKNAHRVLAVKPGNRRELVKDTASLRPCRRQYRSAITATSSSRAAMLISSFLTPPMNVGREQIRQGQWFSFPEHSRRGNVPFQPDRRAILEGVKPNEKLPSGALRSTIVWRRSTAEVGCAEQRSG